jgi:hypothetical protein
VPKPRKIEGRPKKKGVAASEAADEMEETGEVTITKPLRAAQPLPQPLTPVESTERRPPSTTGKLSEGTLKELLQAQEQDQPTAAVAGTPKAER